MVSSPSTPGAYLFLNKDDRGKYEENIEEETQNRATEQNVDGSLGKSVDLMKKLSDYLGY